jgi:hypothetical protein
MLSQLMMGIALAAAQSGGGQAAPARTAQAAEAPIIREARAFMENYARVLRAGDRAGIAALHDRRGAYLQGFAGDEYRTHAEIAARYRDQWEPPRAFAWQNLRFEPLGRDAVAVMGRFVWTPNQGDPVTASYTSVLFRERGQLRLRVEHESLVTPRVRPAASE